MKIFLLTTIVGNGLRGAFKDLTFLRKFYSVESSTFFLLLSLEPILGVIFQNDDKAKLRRMSLNILTPHTLEGG